MRALRRRRRDDDGSAIVELVWLGILLLIPVVYLVLTVFDAQRGAFAVSSAARSAGRAYALAPTDEQGLRAARAAVRTALDDQGLRDVPVRVAVSCTPEPSRCHTGTSVITVRVSFDVDLPLVPQALGGARPAIPVEASHTVPIGQYREDAGAPAE